MTNFFASKSESGYKQIPILSLVVGVITILSIICFGIYSYNVTVIKDEKRFVDVNQIKANVFKISLESFHKHRDSSEIEIIIQTYNALKKMPIGENVCIYDSTANPLFQTYNQSSIEENNAQNIHLQPLIRQLLQQKKDSTLEFSPQKGGTQIGIFTYIPVSKWILLFYCQKKNIVTETNLRFKLFVYILIIISLLVLLSVWLMYISFKIAYKKLQVEQEHATSEFHKWSNVFNNAEWGIASGDPITRKIEIVNEAYANLHGYTRQEIEDMHIADLFADEDQKDLDFIFEEALQKGKLVFETFHIRKDKSKFPVIIDICIKKIPYSDTSIYVLNLQDITLQNRKRDELRESEEKFRSIFEQASVGIAHVAPNGNLLKVNKKMCDILGYEPDELLEVNFQELTHPLDQNVDLEKMQKLIDGGTEFFQVEKRYITKAGSFIWANLNVSCIRYPDNSVKYLIEIVQDISTRKKAEDALKYNEAQYRTYIDNAPYAIFVTDKANSFLEVNNCAVDITGYSTPELLSLSINDLLHCEDQELFESNKAQLATMGKANCELRFLKNDGTELFVQLDSVQINKELSLVFCSDITLRKKIDSALKSIVSIGTSQPSNSYLDLLVQELNKILEADYVFVAQLKNDDVRKSETLSACSNDGLIENFEFDLPGTPCNLVYNSEICIYENNIRILFPKDIKLRELQIEGYLGIPLFDITGMSIGILVALFKKGIKHVDFCKSILEILAHRTSAEIERKYALERIIELNKTLETRVQNRTSKLEKLNTELKDFAYIISHDLKAPLRSISQLTSWIGNDYASKFDDSGKELLQLLKDRVVRMNNLIDGVLQYSRIGRMEEQLEVVDLQQLNHTIIELLSPLKNSRIEFQKPLPTIIIDRIKIQQVFQNLISNAVKYMDKPDGIITLDWSENLEFWQFTVADNGPGIDSKYYERIFQIFQTLAPKDEKESTGIGLSIVKKIVETFGGHIWVESTINHGSTFYFTIKKQCI